MATALGKFLAVLSVLSLSGCAGVGLTFLAAGAGTSAGAGISYTLDSVAYKTVMVPMETLQSATLRTLKRMDMSVTENTEVEAGKKIVAEAGDRTIEIELDRLTTNASRIQVVAKHGWFLRDRATAAEIIAQTDQTLAAQGVTKKSGPAAASPPARK